MAKKAAKFVGDDCRYVVTVGTRLRKRSLHVDTARGSLVLTIESAKGKAKTGAKGAANRARRTVKRSSAQ